MAEQTRSHDGQGAVKTGIYDAPEAKPTATVQTAFTPPMATHTVTTERVVAQPQVDVAPTDLIRWGPVLAGLFAALATLITLSILGLAVGLSSFNYGDPARNFGIGAGIWGAVSALLAFLVGGWIAGRAAAFRGHTSGIMNGAMVWFLAIPLLVYLLGSSIAGIAGTASQVAGAAAGAAAPIAGQVATNPQAQAQAQGAAQSAPQAAATIQAAASNAASPSNVNQAADTAGSTAWSALLSLGLTAAAAVLGGYLGSRPRETVQVTQPTRA